MSVLGEYSDMESLHAAEIAAIASYGTISPGGYNVTYGGDTAPSKSPDVARKISAKALGRGHTDATREKIGSASKTRWEDPEYRAKVEAGVAASFTLERRAQMSAITKARGKGRIVSDETKAKLKGRVFSDEARAKMSASAKARVRAPVSDETRAKLSANAKKAWQNPEVTARRVKSMRVASSSEAFSEKMKLAAKATWADPEIRNRRIASMTKKD